MQSGDDDDDDDDDDDNNNNNNNALLQCWQNNATTNNYCRLTVDMTTTKTQRGPTRTALLRRQLSSLLHIHPDQYPVQGYK